MTQCGKTGLLGGLLVAADTLIIVKRELGLLLADVLGTSGVEIIWTNKHSWYGKSTHVLFYKVCVIWAVVQPSCHRFHGFLLDVLWSADPPSKENPYEDIELERSCLGSKCISPVFSSSVPDTPTKVSNCKCHTEVFWICSEVHYHACVFNSSPASRGFSDKTQSDGASKSVSFAKPTETLASPPPPASAPRLHPAAPTTLPVSPEILTTADGGRSPRYEGLEASCQNRWFMTNWRRFSGGPLLLQSKGWVTEATLCEIKWSDFCGNFFDAIRRLMLLLLDFRWCWESMASLRHAEARSTWRRFLSLQSPAQGEVRLQTTTTKTHLFLSIHETGQWWNFFQS